MYCSKCGKALRDDEFFCSACGTKVIREEQAPIADNSEAIVKNDDSVTDNPEIAVEPVSYEGVEVNDSDNNAKIETEATLLKPSNSKKPIIIAIFAVVVVILLVILIGGQLSNNTNDNSATTTNTVTTTKPITLSEEETLKNLIEDLNEANIRTLKEKFDFLDAEYFGYVNFQDYVKGAKSNLDDYFFIGTDMFDLSQTYSDLKFYKNSDVLEFLKTSNVLDADYLFIYQTVKKNAYEKKEKKNSYVLVRIDNYPDFTQWVVDCHGKDIALDYMVLSGIVDKCNYNY